MKNKTKTEIKGISFPKSESEERTEEETKDRTDY